MAAGRRFVWQSSWLRRSEADKRRPALVGT